MIRWIFIYGVVAVFLTSCEFNGYYTHTKDHDLYRLPLIEPYELVNTQPGTMPWALRMYETRRMLDIRVDSIIIIEDSIIIIKELCNIYDNRGPMHEDYVYVLHGGRITKSTTDAFSFSVKNINSTTHVHLVDPTAVFKKYKNQPSRKNLFKTELFQHEL